MSFIQNIQNHLLLTIISVHLIGLSSVLIVPSTRIILLKKIALFTSLITFFISLFLWVLFENSNADFQFTEKITLFTNSNLHLTLGIDGISLFFVILTTFLIPICLLTSWNSVTKQIKEYLVSFLFLELLLIFVFSVLDILIFYIFFESVLIPMFLIIGIWGARERKIHAAFQFFLYTLFGSLLMLIGILIIYFEVGTTDLQIILTHKFSYKLELFLWFTLFASFAVKVPMFPVHIWLPEAHVEAPTAGSVILAGILLKLGTYGFLRFSIPMFPEATVYFTPLIYTLSIIAIIYVSLTTIRQIDLKKIIAYSSVAHMGFVTLGLFTLTTEGIEGSILLMLSHGLISSALFILVGIVYDRHHTRILSYYGGLTQTMPIYSIFFLFLTFSNISLPGTSSFVAEFLILVATYKVNTLICLLAGIGTIIGAVYAIWLYNRIAFGSVQLNYINPYNDINYREFNLIIPFIVFILLMGIYPALFIDVYHLSILKILSIY